ncbi:MAG: hypothetical protein IJP49_06355 [Bacteroidales bacterium]|nr:hypothetical protein [Bacteroidales bacterium]
MKHKLIYIMAMLAILICAILIWDYSFQIARAIHCDSALVDVVSAAILTAAFYPAGKVVEKKEDCA